MITLKKKIRRLKIINEKKLIYDKTSEKRLSDTIRVETN